MRIKYKVRELLVHNRTFVLQSTGKPVLLLKFQSITTDCRDCDWLKY